MLAFIVALVWVVGSVGCAAPAAGAGPKANVSLAGRWAGSFMGQRGAEGGTVRMVIDPDGRVRGSMRDAGTAAEGASPRMATLQGRVDGGRMRLQITWVGGTPSAYSGDCSNEALGSLGVNLLPESGGAAGMLVVSLHEQGVSGRPPYGEPAKTVQPDFQRQWTGNWIVNWYDGGADYGSGTVSVGPDGTLSGQLVDDAFNTAEWNEPLSATLKGTIVADGTVTGGITWGNGRPGWTLHGKAYFSGPEMFQVQLAPGGATDATRVMTFTFHRGN